MLRRWLLAVGFRPTLSPVKGRVEHAGRRHKIVVDERGVLVELWLRAATASLLVDVRPVLSLEFKFSVEETV